MPGGQARRTLFRLFGPEIRNLLSNGTCCCSISLSLGARAGDTTTCCWLYAHWPTVSCGRTESAFLMRWPSRTKRPGPRIDSSRGPDKRWQRVDLVGTVICIGLKHVGEIRLPGARLHTRTLLMLMRKDVAKK